jgi:hypothetical protein
MGWEFNAKSRPIYPHGTRPGAHCIGGSVWTGAENVALTGIRSLDRPARSESVHQLSFPGTQNYSITTVQRTATATTNPTLTDLTQFQTMNYSKTQKFVKSRIIRSDIDTNTFKTHA